MSELKFTREDNKQYNTISINTENALITIKTEDYNIINIEKTKFGYKKATIKIINRDLKEKLKSWETEINEYLKSEVGTGPITILYGNKIYTKLSFLFAKKKEHHIKVSSIWVNDQNKPFIQSWYVKHTVWTIIIFWFKKIMIVL